MYGLRITLFARGAGGIPTTTQEATDISGKIASIEWTIVDTGWYESCTITMNGATPEEALYYMNLLGCGLLATGKDGRTGWEGRLLSVEATLGGERISRSLDGMANRVKVRFTTVNDVPGISATVNGTDSQTKYGIKTFTETLPKVGPDAPDNRAAAVLDELQWPKSTVSATVGTGDFGETQTVLFFEGWYYTLDDVDTSNPSTTQTATTTQLQTLLTAYNAVNAFLSTNYGAIVASGVSDTEFIAPDTTYREKIEALLIQGNGTNRFAWGVSDDRKFFVSVWAGATPTTIHYIRNLPDGRLFTPAGAVVDYWNVRPNTMRELADMKDLGPASDEPDAAARSYVARVVFRADDSNISVSLEPSENDDLGAKLARMEAGHWT